MNDSRDVIALLERWFQTNGHLTCGIQAGEVRDLSNDAVAFFRSHCCDVIVYDVGLPYLSSWDVAEVLRKLLGDPEIPFVFTCRNVRELTLQTGSEVFELTGTNENLTALMQLVIEAARTRTLR